MATFQNFHKRGLFNSSQTCFLNDFLSHVCDIVSTFVKCIKIHHPYPSVTSSAMKLQSPGSTVVTAC